MRVLAASVLIGLLIASVASATTRHVPLDYATIQAALNASSTGDTVLVAAGTYHENLTMKSGVTLTSESGPGTTILHGDGTNSVISCTGLSATTQISGFTIRSGGRGVFISGGGPRIAGNIIRDNGPAVDGAGVYCENCTALIEENTFQNNTSSTGLGFGGGVFVGGTSDVTIRKNIFRNNSAVYAGGGVGVGGATAAASVLENLFWQNTALYGGGIASGNGANTTIESNTFYANQAQYGAAINIGPASATVSKNIIAASIGIGLRCADGPSVVSGCNDYWGNQSDCVGCSFNPESDLTADPLFCNPPNGDFHLQPGSPCDAHVTCGTIGAYGVGCLPLVYPDHPEILSVSKSTLRGGEESVIIFCLRDSDGGKLLDTGVPAVAGSVFDLGSIGPIDELPDTTYRFIYTAGTSAGTDSVYVYDPECTVSEYAWTTLDITPGGTLRVPFEYPTIQSALDAAFAGDTVLVAAGTYYENLAVVDGVVLISESGADLTTIDGSGGSAVISCSGLSGTTEIVGFTIRSGGRGVFISGGGPRIAGNIIRDNGPAVDGAGVYCENCTALIEENTFQNNTSSTGLGFGGGVFVGGTSDVTIRKNIFRNNSAVYAGGGVGVGGATAAASVLENLFWQNTALYGGGIASGNGANTTIESNTFYANQAQYGAAINIGPASATVSKNIIAASIGIGLRCADGPSVVSGCNDYWGNQSDCVGCSFNPESDLHVNPTFCNALAGDFHLQPESPCADDPLCGRIGAYGIGGTDCIQYYPPHHPEIVSLSSTELRPGDESVIVFCIVDSLGSRMPDEGEPVSVNSESGLGTLGGVVGLPDTTYQVTYTAGFESGTDSISIFDLECVAEQYAWTSVVIAGPEPRIVSVTDVPDDQGRRVTLRWTSSVLDTPPDTLVTHYSIWRSLPETMGEELETLPLVSLGDVTADFDGPGYRMTVLGSSIYYWEWLVNVSAHYFEGYSKTAPTLMDSTGSNPGWHYFLVSAHTANPFVFWDSDPDSGYSVDNLPPLCPQGLAGSYGHPPPELRLTWRRNYEEDFSHYVVYKGVSEDFVPGESYRIGEPTDTFFVDASFDQKKGEHYKISAWDTHGNESSHALLRPDEITHISGPPGAPFATALEQNIPNPFNPVTTIRFSLAESGQVTLRVFDVSGRPVRTLVEERLKADRYEVAWDGRDHRGDAVASGVYLYRFEAPGYADVKKMVLLR